MRQVLLTKKELIYILSLIAILLAGLVIRWSDLEVRPVHHDESLHALNSKYPIVHPNQKYYKYDPMLHGPFLYNFVPEFFKLFGISKWSARAAACFAGSFLLFLPLLFRRYLGDKLVLAVTGFLAISPTLVYWSRFLRHDIFFIFFFYTSLCLAYLVPHRFRSIPVIVGWAFLMTIKENHFMSAAILVGWLVYDFILANYSKIKVESHLTKLKNYLCLHWKYALSALVVGSLVYTYFYTAGFKYWEGPLDGLYRKSLAYWLTAHKEERLSGPFIFNSLVFSLYEFPLFCALFLTSTHHLYRKTPRYLYALLVFLGMIILASLLISYPLLWRGTLFAWMKLKLKIDLIAFLSMVFLAISTSLKHYLEHNRTLSFWAYFFWANLFSYSFIGERVPWLILYPVTIGVVYLVLYWREYFPELSRNQKVAVYTVSVLALVFQFRISLITNFANAGAKTELFSQVHTSPEYERISHEIQQKMDFPSSPTVTKALLYEGDGWPLHWYLYGRPGYSYLVKKNEKLYDYDYIYAKTFNPSLETLLSPQYDALTVPLRWWWVPDYENLNVKNYFKYLISREPWNEPGEYNVKIYKKRKFKFTRPPIQR